jgi:hypothetical protein
MDTEYQQRLLEYLKTSYDPDGMIHFLAVSAIVVESVDQNVLLKARVALTFSDEEMVNTYFDGTDMYVKMEPNDIAFAREEEWADGPPLVQGSPIELAHGWVSELAPPFWVSQDAQQAAIERTLRANDTLR